MSKKIWHSSVKLLVSSSITGIGVLFGLAHQNELLATLSIEVAKGGMLGITKVIQELWKNSKNGIRNNAIRIIFFKSFILTCDKIKVDYLNKKSIKKDKKLDRLIQKFIASVEEIYKYDGENTISESDFVQIINTRGQVTNIDLRNSIRNIFLLEGADKEFCDYFLTNFQSVLHDLFLNELTKPDSTAGWRAFNNLMLESILVSIKESNEINLQNQEEILNKISDMQKLLGSLNYKQLSGKKAKNNINYPDFIKLLQQNKSILKDLDNIKKVVSSSNYMLTNLSSHIIKPKWSLSTTIRKHRIVMSISIIFLILISPWKCKNDEEIKTKDELIENFSQYIKNFEKYIDRGEYKVKKFLEENVEKSKKSIWINLDNPEVPKSFLNTYLEMSREECLKFKNETTTICNEIAPHFSNRVKYLLNEIEDFSNGAQTPKDNYVQATDPITKWDFVYNFLFKNGNGAYKYSSVKSKVDAIKFQKLINLLNKVMEEEVKEYKQESSFTSSIVYKIYQYLKNQLKKPPQKIQFNLADLKLHENIYSWYASDRFFTYAKADSFYFYIVKISEKSELKVVMVYQELNNPMVFSADNIQNYFTKGDTIVCFTIQKRYVQNEAGFVISRAGPSTMINGFPTIMGIYINIPKYQLVKKKFDNVEIWCMLYN